jgi:hypothetical protein
VTFDRPIDPSTYSTDDVSLQVLKQGNWVNIYDSLSAPPETLDSTGSVLSIDLAQPLGPGDYRLVLPEFSQLMGLDGSMPADMGSDQVLAEFTVNTPGVTLADAQNLGTLSSTPLAFSGALDLASDPGAVSLYRFTVAPGHHWRLAVEVSAQRIGSPLLSSLTLFDSTGRPITTADIGRGDWVQDPFLFAGLDPGTYYIGVSGQGNVPGTPGGYDPVSGSPGSIANPQPGGPFILNLATDPADSPVRLLGASLIHSDPADTTPTGLALDFSGLLDVNTLRGDPSPGFYLLDQNGTSHPLAVVGSNEATARYTLLFDAELPTGKYRLMVPDKAHGGATDLAGLTPVRPGMPAGVLLTFTVSPKVVSDPHDIGMLYDDVHVGLRFDDTLPATGSVTYRFVVPANAPYKFETTASTGSLRIELDGPNGTSTYSVGAPNQPHDLDLTLAAGVYHLSFQNPNQSPARLTWLLQELVRWDSLLDNGVGQGPALNLRLINPTSSDLSFPDAPSAPAPAPTPSPSAAPLMGPLALVATGIQAGPGAVAGQVSLPQTAGETVAPAGLLLTIGNNLIGRPISPPDQPVASAEADTATGSATSALPAQGIAAGTFANWYGDPVSEPVDSDQAVAASDAEPVNGALVADEATDAPGADEVVIAAADWLTRAGDTAARWLSLMPDESPAAEPVDEPGAPIVMTRDDAPHVHEQDRVVRAQIGGPLALGIVSMISMRYHRPIRRWLRKCAGRPSSIRRASGGVEGLRGPHLKV